MVGLVVLEIFTATEEPVNKTDTNEEHQAVTMVEQAKHFSITQNLTFLGLRNFLAVVFNANDVTDEEEVIGRNDKRSADLQYSFRHLHSEHHEVLLVEDVLWHNLQDHWVHCRGFGLLPSLLGDLAHKGRELVKQMVDDVGLEHLFAQRGQRERISEVSGDPVTPLSCGGME